MCLSVSESARSSGEHEGAPPRAPFLGTWMECLPSSHGRLATPEATATPGNGSVRAEPSVSSVPSVLSPRDSLLSCVVPTPAGSSEPTGNPRRSSLCELKARHQPRRVLLSFCLSPLSGASVCPSTAVSAPRGGHSSSLRRQSAPLQGLWASTPASPFATTVPAPSVCRVGVGPATRGPQGAWARLVRSAELSLCVDGRVLVDGLSCCSGRWQGGHWALQGVLHAELGCSLWGAASGHKERTGAHVEGAEGSLRQPTLPWKGLWFEAGQVLGAEGGALRLSWPCSQFLALASGLYHPQL